MNQWNSNFSAVLEPVKCWLDAGLSFLYPPVCQVCDEQRATAAEGYVCAACWTRDGGIRFIKPPFCERCGLPFAGQMTTDFECSNCHEMDLHFRSARSAVVADGVVLDVIHRYKYKRALWFENFLADLLVRQAVPELARGQWHSIVPVPLHPVKNREREFNQAERLARHLGRATGLRVQSGLLRRTEYTRTQTLLSRKQRAHNVRNAFVFRGAEPLRGENLVLVDDVFTTGATTSACARVLHEAGAGEVCVWTVARGL
jgi:competence protein ComFC